jgi:hypothetical protein
MVDASQSADECRRSERGGDCHHKVKCGVVVDKQMPVPMLEGQLAVMANLQAAMPNILCIAPRS